MLVSSIVCILTNFLNVRNPDQRSLLTYSCLGNKVWRNYFTSLVEVLYKLEKVFKTNSFERHSNEQYRKQTDNF